MTEFNDPDPEVSRLIRQSPFDDDPRPGHFDELRQRVLHEFDRSLTTNPKRSWKQVTFSWRQLMRNPISRLIAGSIVCLTIVAPWVFFPSDQTSAFAFNKLASAIVEAKTAKFKMEATMEGMPTRTMQCYYLAPGKYRIENAAGPGSVSITDNAAGKQLTLVPAAKMAIVTTSTGMSKEQPSSDPFVRLKQLLSKDGKLDKNPFKPIGEKTIAGIHARGFQSESASGKHTIWGDPATGQLLRVEAIYSGPKRNEVVMTDFEMNMDLDGKLFDLTPPKEYTVQLLELDVSPASEQNFISALKYYSEIGGGELPVSMSAFEVMTSLEKLGKAKVDKAASEPNKSLALAKQLAPIVRGFSFALELPDSADAYYAGAEVKAGTPNRAIFWYKPKGSSGYRIIYADLSVSESETAPQIDGAKRLIKADAAKNSDGKND